MSGEITREMDAAIQHLQFALGRLLNVKEARSPNGRLRVGIIADQKKLASLLLKATSLRQTLAARDE